MQGRSEQLDDIALPDGRAFAAHADSAAIPKDLIAACSAAVDELRASRELIDALEKENTALNARLAIEKQTTALLTELDETRKTETEALRSALAAKNEALTAKDSVISAHDKLIETLKRKKSSPWKRLGDVLVGAGIALVLR
jgi:septal ring factor EnvC (AmiA/AmiB activator)